MLLLRYTIRLTIFLALLGLISLTSHAYMTDKQIVDALTDWSSWNDSAAIEALKARSERDQGYLLIEITVRRNIEYKNLITNFLMVVDTLGKISTALSVQTVVELMAKLVVSSVLDSYNIQTYLFAELEQRLDEFFASLNSVCANQGFIHRLANEMTRLFGEADFERIGTICSTYLEDKRTIQKHRKSKKEFNRASSTNHQLYALPPCWLEHGFFCWGRRRYIYSCWDMQHSKWSMVV